MIDADELDEMKRGACVNFVLDDFKRLLPDNKSNIAECSCYIRDKCAGTERKRIEPTQSVGITA
eukprot:6190754-Pleurochrysis_carterae.AAC.6